jgi:hypothetical protein
MKARRWSGGTAPKFHHREPRLGVVWWLRPHAGRRIPGKEVRYPSYWRLLGPRDRYGQLWVRTSNCPTSCESKYRQRYGVRQTYVYQVNYENAVCFRSNITADTWTDTAAWIQKNRYSGLNSEKQKLRLLFCWILFAVCTLWNKRRCFLTV